MTETGPESPQTILLVGLLIVAALLMKGALRRLGVPPLVGHILLGVGLAVAGSRFGALPEGADTAIGLLANIGVVFLLFHVGLRSNVRGLVAQLPRASPVWLGDVVVSGGLAYLVARHGLEADVVPSLFVAVALMATSVGISAAVWEEAGMLRTRNGELLLDVAEADDLSSIVAMVLLFAAVPVLGDQQAASLATVLTSAAAWLGLKAFVFAAACLLFAFFLEERFTRALRRLTDRPDPVIVMAGAGVVIAALAGWLGLSLAVGALLAGLLFSRDREAVRMEPSFRMLDDLFTPFFFIGIGLQIEPAALGGGLAAGALLLAPAVLGKLLGTGIPSYLQIGWPGAALIGVSMLPRAEIAMVVAQHGRRLGDWAMPPRLFAALAAISLVTALGTPTLVRALLARSPRQGRGAR